MRCQNLYNAIFSSAQCLCLKLCQFLKQSFEPKLLKLVSNKKTQIWSHLRDFRVVSLMYKVLCSLITGLPGAYRFKLRIQGCGSTVYHPTGLNTFNSLCRSGTVNSKSFGGKDLQYPVIQILVKTSN